MKIERFEYSCSKISYWIHKPLCFEEKYHCGPCKQFWTLKKGFRQFYWGVASYVVFIKKYRKISLNYSSYYWIQKQSHILKTKQLKMINVKVTWAMRNIFPDEILPDNTTTNVNVSTRNNFFDISVTEKMLGIDLHILMV